MQVGRPKLTPEECQHWIREGRSIYCGKRQGSPVKERTLVSRALSPNYSSRPPTQVQLWLCSSTLSRYWSIPGLMKIAWTKGLLIHLA